MSLKKGLAATAFAIACAGAPALAAAVLGANIYAVGGLGLAGVIAMMSPACDRVFAAIDRQYSAAPAARPL